MEEISLNSLFCYIKEKIKLIMLIIFICFFIGIFYSFVSKPVYYSESRIALTSTDMNLNKLLSTTYVSSVNSTDIVNEVINNLNLNLDSNSLSSKISATSSSESNIISIYVADTDKYLAIEIANEVANVFVKYIKETYGNNDLKIINKGIITSENISKQYIKKIGICVGAGFIASFGYVLICFYFDNTIKCEDDIKKIGYDIYGAVPKEKNNKYYVDSLMNIKSNITVNNTIDKSKVLLFTSVDDTREKSYIIADVAKLYAAVDKKVVIIDCDLKNDIQAKIFGIENNDYGYTDLISNIETNDVSFIKPTKINNLFVITNGNKVIDSVEIVSSARNKKVIELLKEKFDVIIIDAPVCIGANGTTSLMENTNVNILVVTHELTNLEHLDKAHKELDNKINGVVVTGINPKYKNYSKYLYKNYYNKK